MRMLSLVRHGQANMKFPKRQVLFTIRGKEYALRCNVTGHTIPVVASSTFSRVIKTSVLCYMVFVKEYEQSLSALNVSKGETKEELEMSKLFSFKTSS